MTNRHPPTWRPRISARQAGAFTRAQAIAEGLNKRQVAYRLESGIFCKVAGIGLRHRQDPVTPAMLAHAAHLTWPDTVLAGPTVAMVLGAPLRLHNAHVISQFRRKPQLQLIPHEFKILPWERDSWRGLPITTLSRSLIDAFVVLPKQDAQALFVWAHTHDRIDTADLELHLEHFPGRWGNTRLRQFLAQAHTGVMSPAEALAHDIFRRYNLTGWKPDVTIRDGLGIIARVDVLFPTERVVVEIDGRRFHGSDRFQADRTRDNRLQNAGYLVLRFTWQDLTTRQGMVVTQIRQALAQRTPGFRA